jgi:hypothetical protein
MIRQYINTLLLVFGLFFTTAQTTANREYQVKAAFLFNFTQFVEWPANALPETKTPLVIGVLGQNPFGTYLQEIISGEQVNGHPLVIQQYKNAEEIKTCHILFINLTEKDKPEQVIASLKGRSILTVGDGANFIKQGGMIRFITRDNKIQFQINPESAKGADLMVSAKLLKLAEIVH